MVLSLNNAYYIDQKSGLISQTTFIESPNYDDRPINTEIDLLVIHAISLPPGEFGGGYVQAFFSNALNPAQHPYFQEIAHLTVSSHLFIDREACLWQFVPFHKKAWHAGVSFFNERENCNDFSIGIELEGTDTLPYTAAQYARLIQVTVALLQAYPAITLDRIVGHSEIAPGRKTDPGEAFDWQRYKQAVKNLLESKHIP